MRFFDPLDDYLFSQYMASKGMENQLKSFINAVILENDDLSNSNKGFNQIFLSKNRRKLKNGVPVFKCSDLIDSIDIIANKMIAGEIKGKKKCILDLRSIADDGRRFIVEIQRRDQ
ncbi:MAG: Rpn family recombination-promoting nuclease/putative transposase [Methanobrevibacter sp.]|jgi:hypothetical protein|nr:Rpn family recombination-promoting nuclease/putative transposase [Candidatus Methanovirga aequatorialis]